MNLIGHCISTSTQTLAKWVNPELFLLQLDSFREYTLFVTLFPIFPCGFLLYCYKNLFQKVQAFFIQPLKKESTEVAHWWKLWKLQPHMIYFEIRSPKTEEGISTSCGCSESNLRILNSSPEFIYMRTYMLYIMHYIIYNMYVKHLSWCSDYNIK